MTHAGNARLQAGGARESWIEPLPIRCVSGAVWEAFASRAR